MGNGELPLNLSRAPLAEADRRDKDGCFQPPFRPAFARVWVFDFRRWADLAKLDQDLPGSELRIPRNVSHYIKDVGISSI